MGLAGQIGAGAANALDDVIVQVLAKKKFDEQIRAQQAQEAAQQQQIGLGQQRLAQDASQHADMMGLRGRELDQRDTMRRDEANRAGVADMERQAAMVAAGDRQRAVDELIGQIPEGPKRVVTGLRARGVNAPDLPDPTEDAAQRAADLADYEAKKKLDLRYRPPTSGGDDLDTYRAKKAIDAEFRAPSGTDPAEAVDTAREIQRISRKLTSHPGMSSAFGVVQSRLPTIRQSTADAETLRDAMMSLLTLENTGKLKGVLSNADMEILRRASTTLDPKMGDAAAAEELRRLDQVMSKITGEPAGGGAGPRVIRGPDGKLMLQR